MPQNLFSIHWRGGLVGDLLPVGRCRPFPLVSGGIPPEVPGTNAEVEIDSIHEGHDLHVKV